MNAPRDVIVGYDNELGKGDDKQINGLQAHYKFVNVEKMVVDFLADVERVRNENDE